MADQDVKMAARKGFHELRAAKRQHVEGEAPDGSGVGGSRTGAQGTAGGPKPECQTGGLPEGSLARNISNPDSVDEVVPVLAKLALVHDEWIRRLVPAVGSLTYTVPSAHPFIVRLKQSLQRYNAAVKEQGKGHQCGPPEAWVAMELVEMFTDTPPAGSKKEDWQALQEQLSQLLPEEIAYQFLPTFKLSKAFAKKGAQELTKVVFLAKGEALSQTLKLAFASCDGAQQKIGNAPRAPLAREVQHFLNEGSTGKRRGKK